MRLYTEFRSVLPRCLLLLVLLSSTPAVVLAAMFTVTGGGTVFATSDVGSAGEAVSFSFAYDPAIFSPVDNYQPGYADYTVYPFVPVSATGASSGAFSLVDFDKVFVYDDPNHIADEFSFQSFAGSKVSLYNTDATAINGFPQDFEDLHTVFLDQYRNTSLWHNAGIFEFSTPSSGILRIDSTSISIMETAVPVPPAPWLLGSGLVAVPGTAKKRQSTLENS